ncbi:MAG: hypothetical protein K2N26_01660 [Oscillospiraceae bacterium]|nr:hypothetical protein [Oscillospiraceae bacterium]
MTMVQRKRAAKLQKTMYLYSKSGRARLLMLLVAVLQITIIAVASISGIKNDEAYLVAPCAAMFTFVQFMACLFPVGVDSSINERVTQEAYRGSAMPAKFMCSLPFEARDLLNFKVCIWEKAAAVNVLFVTLGHISALIVESRGYAVYHGVAGLFTLMAIIDEALFIVLFLIKSTKVNVVMCVFIGFSFSFAGVFIDIVPDMSADTMALLKIFSGVSGIIIYIAATFIIAAAGELYIKYKKNVSWNIFK